MATKKDQSWNLMSIPPTGNDALPQFIWDLYETSSGERLNLDLPSRWLLNHALYRGYHYKGPKRKNFVNVNLFFANVERTKANITASNPKAEVKILDGHQDEADQILSARLDIFWNETSQRKKLASTVLNMELYGITIEKSYYDRAGRTPDNIIVDPFAFFPAPGVYEDLGTECPYIAHAYPMIVEEVEAKFNLSPGDVMVDDLYSVLGEERDDSRPQIATGQRIGNDSTFGRSSTVKRDNAGRAGDFKERRALVIECWIRDTNLEKYPDGVRVVTVTNNGNLVLSDMPNPNINWNMDQEASKKTHAWGRFPFYVGNSYVDTTSIWGFSAAEQVSDIALKVDEIISKAVNWVMRAMAPPLVIPKDFGITRSMINNSPNLILMPTKAGFLREAGFIPIPNLPNDFFKVMDILLGFFDRVYQIEDADRGVGPTGVIAASAIVALQERNATLLQHKITTIDYIVESRGKWAISHMMNFGSRPETVTVNDSPVEFVGSNLIGRQFSYIVESGSTTPKTSLQVAEQAEKLYVNQAIDRQAYLEALNFPGWKEIIERVGEGQLDQALQILVQAGLPEESAIQLRQALMETQGGPGNRTQNPPTAKTPSPGTPKSRQGERV